jgi:ATP-dependent Clp protease protease subunit
MTRWPPLQPEPPEPPMPHRTPWLPEPRPTAPGPVSATASLVVGAGDWLVERLLDQRVIALAGEVDDEVANRTVAELALLDATGDEPIELRLSGVTTGVDQALTLLDALDLVGAPVHATALGTLTGPAVALLAVADVRTAGAHTTLLLVEPRGPRGEWREVEARATEFARRLRRLQERLAQACGRDVDEVAADMRTRRSLSATEAQSYGLLDTVETGRRPAR